MTISESYRVSADGMPVVIRGAGNPDEPIESRAARYRAEVLHLIEGMMEIMDRAKADGITIGYNVNFNPAIGKHMIVALSLTKEL